MSNYDKEKLKSDLRNALLSLVKKEFDDCSKKTTELNNKKSGESANQLGDIKQLKDFSLEYDGIIQKINKTRNLPNIQKQEFNMVLRKLCTTLNEFVDYKKHFPIRMGKSVEEALNDLRDNRKQLDNQLNLLDRSSWCACCNRKAIRKRIALLMIETNKYLYFWEKFRNMEAREGTTYLAMEFKNESKLKDDINRILEGLPEPFKPPKPEPKQEPPKTIYVPAPNNHVCFADAHEQLFGFGRSQEIESAITYYKEQAGKKNYGAMNFLGQIYLEGKFQQMNLDEANLWYSRSYDSNKNSEAAYRLGQINEKRAEALLQENTNLSFQQVQSETDLKKNDDKRRKYLKDALVYYKLAVDSQISINSGKLVINEEQGLNLQALTDFAWHLEQDLYKEFLPESKIDDNKNNLKIVSEIYRKCHEYNYPKASNNLGHLLIENEDVLGSKLDQRTLKQNVQFGFQCFEQASKYLHPSAIYNIGKCFEQNLPIKENGRLAHNERIERALIYFKHAADLGNCDAIMSYAYYNLKAGVLLSDQSLYPLVHHLLLLVLQNDVFRAEAYYYLGILYEGGYGVPQSDEYAYKYFRLSIEKSKQNPYAPGYNKLGDYHYNGICVSPNLKAAKKYYKKSSKLNYSISMVNLGVLYLEKSLPIEDTNKRQKIFKKAEKYLTNAAELNNDEAYLHIGMIYLEDKYENKDEVYALETLKKSAELGNLLAKDILISRGIDFKEDNLAGFKKQSELPRPLQMSVFTRKKLYQFN